MWAIGRSHIICNSIFHFEDMKEGACWFCVFLLTKMISSLSQNRIMRSWLFFGVLLCRKGPEIAQFQKATEFSEKRKALLPQLPVVFFLEVHFRIGVFLLLKPFRKEWLDVAKRIWAHLDWIARSETKLLGVWMSVLVRQWPCLGHLVYAVVQQCCKFMYWIWWGFSFRETTLALAKINKSTGSSKYGHNSYWEKFSSLYDHFRL